MAKKKAATVEWLGYHFLTEDRKLRYTPRKLVKVGQTLKVKGPLELCSVGLHASKRAIDALEYAPGPILCRVRLSGEILEGDDKACATERTVLAMADATNTLHEFACRCAETALRTAKVEDVRCWQAIETKRKWLKGEATDQELDAAMSAAMSAAWSAAWSAAMSAAMSAAWSAAMSAAWSAAMSAAWSAAWSAQNNVLESMFDELLAQPQPKAKRVRKARA